MNKMQEKLLSSAMERFKNSDKFRELERQAKAEQERIEKLEKFKDGMYYLMFSGQIENAECLAKIHRLLEEIGLSEDYTSFCDDYQ